MFIRIKKVNGQRYAYKVQNTWTKYGPRQKHLGYIGKLAIPERKDSKSFEEFLHNTEYDEYLQKSGHRQIIKDLIELELLNHGFEETSNEYFRFFGVFVNLELRKVITTTLKQTEKPACVKLNHGFLCNETMKELFHFKLGEKEDDEDENIYRLANAFVGAGINVPKDFFVKIYEKILMYH